MRLRDVYSVATAGPAAAPPAGGAPHAPVLSVRVLLSDAPCAVVHGGGVVDAPQSLALLTLRDGEGAEVSHVPWFGSIQGFGLVRPPGSFHVDDAPSAVITLTQGGYLCIYDVSDRVSEAFVPDFQARPVGCTLLMQARTPLATPTCVPARMASRLAACSAPMRLTAQGHVSCRGSAS